MHGTLVDVKVIKDAVRLACRAPSLHNSQPWRLDVDGQGVHLFLDTSRIMPSTDRSAREAIISCGALLDHLRVAMAAAGWKAHVDRFPNPNNLDPPPRRCDPASPYRPASLRRADGVGVFRTAAASRIRHRCGSPGLMSDDVWEELAEMSKLTTRYASMTRHTIPNYTGGQHHSSFRRESRTVNTRNA